MEGITRFVAGAIAIAAVLAGVIWFVHEVNLNKAERLIVKYNYQTCLSYHSESVCSDAGTRVSRARASAILKERESATVGAGGVSSPLPRATTSTPQWITLGDSGGWSCSYRPTMDNNWRNDVLCTHPSKGADRPLITGYGDFVEEWEARAFASDEQARRNS